MWTNSDKESLQECSKKLTWWIAVMPDMLILLMSMSTLTLLSILITSSPSLSFTTSWNTISSGNRTLRAPGWVLAKKLALRDIVVNFQTLHNKLFLLLHSVHICNVAFTLNSSNYILFKDCSNATLVSSASHVYNDGVKVLLGDYHEQEDDTLCQDSDHAADNFIQNIFRACWRRYDARHSDRRNHLSRVVMIATYDRTLRSVAHRDRNG